MDFCICFGAGFCVMNGIWASSARWRILDSDTLVDYCVTDLLPEYVLPSLRTPCSMNLCVFPMLNVTLKKIKTSLTQTHLLVIVQVNGQEV